MLELRNRVFANLGTFLAFFSFFAFLVIVFSAAGRSMNQEREGLEKIVAFGEPKTYMPLAFSFLLGAGLQFFFPAGTKAFEAARWVTGFGRDGFLVFCSLIFALILGVWETSLFSTLWASALLVLVTVIVVSSVETAISVTQDHSLRLLFGFIAVTSALPLPFLNT